MPDAHPVLVDALNPDLANKIRTRMRDVLHQIIQANAHSRFGRTSDVLAGFRDALPSSSHTDRDTCFQAFRAHVPLTEYDTYEPYIQKFLQKPCKISDVVDLLAPGLPQCLGMSSSTSGKACKLIPRYRQGSEGLSDLTANPPLFFPSDDRKMCLPMYCGVVDVLDVKNDEDDDVHARIPCLSISSFVTRRQLGFSDFEKDSEHLSKSVPGVIGPFGLQLIHDYHSMLLSHAAFALADRTLDTLSMMFSTTFVDFIRCIDKEWDTLVDAVESGELPHFPDTEDVYGGIAPSFQGDASRADELRKIGPPSRTASGWAKRVWPKLDLLCSVCTGGFGRVLPQIRTYLGPDVGIRNPTYTSTECAMAVAYDSDPLCHYKILTDNYIELLEITDEEEDGEVKSLWEVEVGKSYEPIVTTRDGLWRYRTWDAVQVRGFSPVDGAPIIEYQKRRDQSLRISHVLITEADVMASVAGIEKFDQAEYTTWLDDRFVPPAIGFFVEVDIDSADLLSSVRDTIMRGLIMHNANFADGVNDSTSNKPTVRILAPGTFGEFRLWKGSVNGTGCSQVKVPVIMTDEKAQAFVLERVVGELE